MSNQKNRVPAVDGWFIADGEAALLGSQCNDCKSYFFPKETFFCRNPGCRGSEFTEVPLSQRGKLWSYTNNCYPPPKPYVAADPFVPYIIAAVELDQEKMVVLGQVVADVEIADLKVGMEMQLVLDQLYEDDDNEYIIWKWKPVTEGN
ncbi:MAG: OB-fold domain-containing protein [Candidatus Binatia bacterium]|nr:OB-fold domain-containing protein [Candidatus Binatia bacterium]